MAGAVPSILHQKVKFIASESLITVTAEEDMVAMTTDVAIIASAQYHKQVI